MWRSRKSWYPSLGSRSWSRDLAGYSSYNNRNPALGVLWSCARTDATAAHHDSVITFTIIQNQPKAGFILHARVYARIGWLSAQLFILLSTVVPSAYADCRRQSSNLLNFEGQRRPAQAFQPITKALQGHRGLTRCSDRDVCGRIPTHTLACLYFHSRRNLRYAVATHRQPQAWTSAPAAGAYARMEYKPGLMVYCGVSHTIVL